MNYLCFFLIMFNLKGKYEKFPVLKNVANDVFMQFSIDQFILLTRVSAMTRHSAQCMNKTWFLPLWCLTSLMFTEGLFVPGIC